MTQTIRAADYDAHNNCYFVLRVHTDDREAVRFTHVHKESRQASSGLQVGYDEIVQIVGQLSDWIREYRHDPGPM